VVAFALLDEFNSADLVSWLGDESLHESLQCSGNSDLLHLLLATDLLSSNTDGVLESGDGEFSVSWDSADGSSESLCELGATSESENDSLASSSGCAVGVGLGLSAHNSSSGEFTEDLSVEGLAVSSSSSGKMVDKDSQGA